MNLRDFRRAGHLPTLFSAFLYFDISFMVWVLVGALGNSIAADFHLTPGQKGLVVAVPLLGGAVLRLLLGLMTDHWGARRTAIIGLVLTLVPLALGWLWADSFSKLLLIGLLLGVAGASFAAALPLASRWYPPEHQGLAMGIAGAGNSGTALATFFGPRLAEQIGWHAVFGLALIPIVVTLIVFCILAKDSPKQPAPQPLSRYAAVLAKRDTWWFCFFYSITFGGFVGLASILNIFFHDQYGLSAPQAGLYTTLCVISGSFLRPVGGYFSDRFGGLRVLTALYLGVGLMMVGLATSPALGLGVGLMFVTMGMLGLGNGAVFQLVPQRFSQEIGVVTGIVGAAGGIGGFLLPNLLGQMKQWTLSFGGGFMVFSLIAFGGAIALSFVSQGWQRAFLAKGGLAVTTARSPDAEPLEIGLEPATSNAG
ncbi:MAG TPA: nitrate/nitrite transporter [Pirellulales bacterium]|jgi:NNP family nitrate/nitrite transporter-like MFS transporter|nr:nitrate/nitrite transporter [Pirellulales bacterium]